MAACWWKPTVRLKVTKQLLSDQNYKYHLQLNTLHDKDVKFGDTAFKCWTSLVLLVQIENFTQSLLELSRLEESKLLSLHHKNAWTKYSFDNRHLCKAFEILFSTNRTWFSDICLYPPICMAGMAACYVWVLNETNLVWWLDFYDRIVATGNIFWVLAPGG